MLYFLLGTLVLTLYIDVVLSLSINFHRCVWFRWPLLNISRLIPNVDSLALNANSVSISFGGIIINVAGAYHMHLAGRPATWG